MPVAPIQGVAYVAIILAVRAATGGRGCSGNTMHPAVIRQWCWVGATAAAYLLLLAGRACACAAARVPDGPAACAYAVPVLFAGALWRLLSGVGYLHGALFGIRAGGE